MTEPSSLPPELEPLVAAERDAPTGTAEEHARIRGRLAAAFGFFGAGAGGLSAGGGGAASGGGVAGGGGAVAGGAGSAAAGGTAAAGAGTSAATAAVGTSLAIKPILVVAAIASAAGGGYYLGSERESPPKIEAHSAEASPRASTAPARGTRARVDTAVDVDADEALEAPDVAVAQTGSVPSASAAPEPRARATTPRAAASGGAARHPPRRSARAVRTRTATPPTPAEAALVGTALKAVEAGDSRAALTALTAHEREFPDGVLAEERDALRVRALIEAGREAEAKRRARDFAVEFPDSVHLRTVERALAQSAQTAQTRAEEHEEGAE